MNPETRLANGIESAMKSVHIREGPIDEEEEETDASEQTKIKALSEAGALPPAEMDGYDGYERDVEVMSEAPEIDTTRADKPPMFRASVNTCIRRTLLLFVAALIVTSIVMIVLFSVGMWETDCDVDSIYDANLMLRTNTSKAMAQHACIVAKEFVKETLGEQDHP
jgi:hypothetical protein